MLRCGYWSLDGARACSESIRFPFQRLRCQVARTLLCNALQSSSTISESLSVLRKASGAFTSLFWDSIASCVCFTNVSKIVFVGFFFILNCSNSRLSFSCSSLIDSRFGENFPLVSARVRCGCWRTGCKNVVNASFYNSSNLFIHASLCSISFSAKCIM